MWKAYRNHMIISTLHVRSLELSPLSAIDIHKKTKLRIFILLFVKDEEKKLIISLMCGGCSIGTFTNMMTFFSKFDKSGNVWANQSLLYFILVAYVWMNAPLDTMWKIRLITVHVECVMEVVPPALVLVVLHVLPVWTARIYTRNTKAV